MTDEKKKDWRKGWVQGPAKIVYPAEIPTEPEYVGEFPTERTDIEVEPSKRKLGFTVHQTIGCEIVKLPDDIPAKTDDWTVEHQDRVTEIWKRRYENRITSADGIKVGDRIIVVHLISGPCIATVTKLDLEAEDCYATSGSATMYPLVFKKHDHDCWSCSSAFNLNALKKLELYSDKVEVSDD